MSSPRQALVREPEGSAGDPRGQRLLSDGRWTVVLRRKLDTGNPDDTKSLHGRSSSIILLPLPSTTILVGGRRHHVFLGPASWALTGRLFRSMRCSQEPGKNTARAHSAGGELEPVLDPLDEKEINLGRKTVGRENNSQSAN